MRKIAEINLLPYIHLWEAMKLLLFMDSRITTKLVTQEQKVRHLH